MSVYDENECQCQCHGAEGVEHIRPCCYECPVCGLRIKMEAKHLHQCPRFDGEGDTDAA